jgi:hypothetical protein
MKVMKEGRKEGDEGRKVMNEGRKEGQTVERTEGRKDGR